LDEDGDVDREDIDAFEQCATGPGNPYGPGQLPLGCVLGLDPGDHIRADFDKDGDVDQVDLSVAQRCFSGSAIEPKLGCDR
jgi:hypothetical protein